MIKEDMQELFRQEKGGLGMESPTYAMTNGKEVINKNVINCSESSTHGRQLLERVHRRATKMWKCLEGKIYEDHLKCLGLPSAEQRS